MNLLGIVTAIIACILYAILIILVARLCDKMLYKWFEKHVQYKSIFDINIQYIYFKSWFLLVDFMFIISANYPGVITFLSKTNLELSLNRPYFILFVALLFATLLEPIKNVMSKLCMFYIIFSVCVLSLAPSYLKLIQSDTNYYVLENGLSCKLIRKYNNNAICKVEKDLYIKESVHILDLTKKEYVLEYTKKSAKDLFFEKLSKLRGDKNLPYLKENYYFTQVVNSFFSKTCSVYNVSDSVQIKYRKNQLPNNQKELSFNRLFLYNLNLRYEDIDNFINKSEFFLNKDVEYFTKYITADNNTVYVFILNLTPENEKEWVDYVNSEEFKNLDCDKKE